ncbi:glutathione synthetase-like [Parambassis ranga]|uniref:Glutathione synthetase n=1 Tax=Parambassis ranga TaxID=210632 RepID=A0A6P7IKD4_9TELE|nr:glutathione synthetase-like [Parambassis ranga]
MPTNVFLQQLITDPGRLTNLADKAKETAFEHGLIMRTRETPNSSEVVTYIPFTLFPSPVPKADLLQAVAVHTHFNMLVDRVSQDPDFLEEALGSTIQADDFTAKLFDIYRQVQKEGQIQSIVVGLNRSDYMLDMETNTKTCTLKQVEINTIAAAGFGVTDSLPKVHRSILRSVGLVKESECVQDSFKTPQMCAALAKAWELYGEQNAVILFLVEDVQLSKLCHRYLEKELWDRNVPVIRRTFDEVSRHGSLDGDKRLFIHSKEVAVVYYRYGYMPDHYNQQRWAVRLMMEQSLAVKCPNISTHLVGTKKVQQVLSRPGALERFFPNQPGAVEQIRAVFAGLYTLDMGPEGDRAVDMALENPHNYVLKAQREGGGNNIFGEDIVRVLQEVKRDQRRAAYILMDRIRPKTVPNILLEKGLPLTLASVCYEIGVHGAYVRHRGQMVLNETVGVILRTKSIEHDDSGVCNGMSVFDTPLIIPSLSQDFQSVS